MRRQAVSIWSGCSPSLRRRSATIEPIGRRHVRIFAMPNSSSPAVDELSLDTEGQSTSPDAKFEVLGSPFSLLSVHLSPSQNLYTRRGTLVAVSGKAENAVSTLSLLSPFTRALVGVPFLYQKISSASPIAALISTKSPLTSFAVIHLDGRLDWLITQRSALLAWTGHALTVKPRVNTRLSLRHWGNTITSGRGLVALVGKGQIYQISLKAGEEYIAHPSNVIAYTQNALPPQPYRFRSTTLNLQVPSITAMFPDIRFFNELKKSSTWKFLAETLFKLRTWTRRSIWGDRLFLQFKGPTTLLLQSRGARLTDSLTARDVQEIADTPAGAVQQSLNSDGEKSSTALVQEGNNGVRTPIAHEVKPEKMSFATVRGGKVNFTQG